MIAETPRLAIDTNLLVYAAGVHKSSDDAWKQQRTKLILSRMPTRRLTIPAQVLGEFYNVLVRKGHYHPSDASIAVSVLRDEAWIEPTTSDTIRIATDLSARHGLAIWDAISFVAAAEARAAFLLSEDMQHGFMWRGLEIVNPFSEDVPAALTSLFTA